MNTKQGCYTLTLLFLFLLSVGQGQVVIPPENPNGKLLINPELTFPDNFDQAVTLLEEEQSKNDPETALYLGYQALQWAKEASDHDRTQKAYHLIGLYYATRGFYQEADSIYQAAYQFTERDSTRARIYLRRLGLRTRTGDWSEADFFLSEARRLIGNDTASTLMAHYHFSKGLYHFESKFDMVQALLDYQKAKLIDSTNRSFVNIINHNLAGVYTAIEDYDKASDIGEELLAYAQAQNSSTDELFALYLLGHLAIENEKYDETKSICYEAMALRDRTGVSEAFGYTYFLLGESHLAQQQLDSAEYYFILGLDISREQGDAKELVDCTGGLMKLRLAQERYAEAIELGERVLQLSQRPDQPVQEELATAYYALGRYDEAYTMLKKGVERRDEEDLSGRNAAIISALLEDQFRKERQAQNSAYEQQLTNQRFTLITSALGLLLFSALFAFYLQHRSRQKLKELNKSLAESNAALQQFAYITSHDLKEPIRNITSFSGLLDRRLKQQDHTEEEREFLEFITSNAVVLHEIVNSLQIFTKISFGELEREAVRLEDVFVTVEDNLQQTIEETKGQLSFHNPKQVEKVLFSRPMLILVLQNLVQNGFKYNEAEQPQVKVTVTPHEGKTLFTVVDNGVGIEPDYFDRIFSPFKTLANKSVTQSSGLGLSICKNILERYGGQIWVDSDGKNGSTFSFVV